jgi:hypothetical protein
MGALGRCLGALVVCLVVVAGCDRHGEVVDLEVLRPEKLDGTLHVSWAIGRPPTYRTTSCADAGARYVLVVMEGETTRTYRIPCESAPREAWIPLKQGSYLVRAELADAGHGILSKTSEMPAEIRKGNEQLTVPFMFTVH